MNLIAKDPKPRQEDQTLSPTLFAPSSHFVGQAADFVLLGSVIGSGRLIQHLQTLQPIVSTTKETSADLGQLIYHSLVRQESLACYNDLGGAYLSDSDVERTLRWGFIPHCPPCAFDPPNCFQGSVLDAIGCLFLWIEKPKRCNSVWQMRHVKRDVHVKSSVST